MWKNNHLPEVEGEERKLTEVGPTLKDVSPVHLQQDDVNLGHHLPDEEILCFCLDLSHLSLLVNMIMSSQYQVHLNNPLHVGELSHQSKKRLKFFYCVSKLKNAPLALVLRGGCR